MRARLVCGLLVLASVSGCAAVVKPMITPEGKNGFSVSCDGSADDWSTCYNAMAAACKGKYNIIDKQQDSTATPYGPMVKRHVIAECAAATPPIGA